MEPIIITTDNFESEVLNSDVPVLVDFWAPWCGPCRMLAQTISRVAANSDGSYKVAKINIDDEEYLAEKYGVTAIPTLKVFNEGKVVNESVGLVSEDMVMDLLK